jgi:signal recognition particle subunit SRP14
MFCEADTFLNELHKLFERKKKGGTVWVTMKRTNMKPRNGKKQYTQEYKCLIRATDGKKKISTAVSPSEYLKFQASYGLILRAQMDALKKREKVKSKK